MGACLALLSIGAPNACVDASSQDLKPSQTGDGSWANPYLVRRDNLALGGTLSGLPASVRSTVSSPFLSDGQWTNLKGHIELAEYREHGWYYATHYSPILPYHPFTGPGDATYATRAGQLVHGNKYAMSVSATDSTGKHYSAGSPTKYVKLADDTLV